MPSFVLTKQEGGGWLLERNYMDKTLKKSAHTTRKNAVDRIFLETAGTETYIITAVEPKVGKNAS